MKYILLIYENEKLWEQASRDEMERVYAEHGAYGEALAQAGVMRGGAELKPTSTATTIRFDERARNLASSEPAECAERECAAGFRFQGGMATGEEEPQPVVLDT